MCPQAGTSERKERSRLGLPAADLQQLIPQTGINTTSLIGLFSKTRLLCFNSRSLRKAGEVVMQPLTSLSRARGPFPCSIRNVPVITLRSGALMEDIQTACQDCWVRDGGGRETAVRAGGGRCRASLLRGREGALPGDGVGGRSSLLRGSHG